MVLVIPVRKFMPIVMIVIALSLVHLWYSFYMMDLSNDVTDYLVYAKRKIHKNIPITNVKYILHWADYYMVNDENGEHIYPTLNCSFRNCYFTKDRSMFNGDIRKFDVVMFHDEFLEMPGTYDRKHFPAQRSDRQLYIFTSIESSYNKPACDLFNDDFYNWTFTYRLDSDIVWPYFVVLDLKGHMIAPNKTVNWKTSNESVSKEIKQMLARKNKTAIWLVSNCKAHSFRDEYLSYLQEHLYDYDLHIDVYGRCTQRTCGDKKDCENLIKTKYYFYMAFENSLSEDYVTEKVLHAYDNYAIPIVFGGANYSRFLPKGSYINANDLHPYILATKMKQIIDDPILHESYFKWTNLYKVFGINRGVYHPLCELCAVLNENSVKKTPAIKKFRYWWNGGPAGMRWCLPESFWNDTRRGVYETRNFGKP